MMGDEKDGVNIRKVIDYWIEDLIKITTFNLESRYPDEKRSFRKKCTDEFTRKELDQIEDVFRWLRSMV